MAMGRLRKQEIGNAAGVYNLMRNIGGSVGIATVTTLLVRGAQTHQTYLAANVTATNPNAMAALQGLQAKFFHEGASAYTAQQDALGAIYRNIQQQASLLAYADNFRLIAYMALLGIPLLLLVARLRPSPKEPPK
jgi:DHA2 family multidrug resistance protein